MTGNNRTKDLDEPMFFDESPPHTDDDFFIPEPSWNSLDTINDRPYKTGRTDSNRKINSESKPHERPEKKVVSKDLNELLKKIFHFDFFRPFQQKVCESVITGNDLLLVMPTGSGKSLCYQLPGIARAGTTLVISPLIALMEDQALALQALGLNAERIHSGRSRIQSRQVCSDYLKGNLDFLFIAPERLAIPGFPEMLARRKPTLIAIDEAHCISQWGHDFRPDYRLMGDRLPILMPAPIIAMTATATPRVQEDIVRQLGIEKADLHIHGFRRTNISIELTELLPSERSQKVSEILKDSESRPAIIYAPTRQKAEDLAMELKGSLKVAAYHAGLTPDTRDKVQTAFMSGKIEVIVATIAFGMGIDKKDIRTVIHTAMPGSLEGFYQEIGRAGRDGKPSRAILLHSYGDRRIHQFFHEKSYPGEDVLKRIYNCLTKEKTPSEKLREKLKMEQEEFDTALEKLWIHGGAQVEPDETVSRGHDKWHVGYNRQSTHRLNQIDEISRFTSSSSCRMLYLVRHFGDREDNGRSCGICDFCSPLESVASKSRRPDSKEADVIADIIRMLKGSGGIGTGKLYNMTCPGSIISRNDFENLLRSLGRAGLITLEEHNFEKDNETIRYTKAELTHEGYSYHPGDSSGISITSQGRAAKSHKGKIFSSSKKNEVKVIRRPAHGMAENTELHTKIKEWRLAAAKRQGLPAFRIFSNRVLDSLSSALPTTHDELLMVEGVGPRFDERYGNEIIRLVKEYLRR
jgi:RecQ family ATP-dependent DNA helicase